jgi:hypothetical protein
MVSPFKADGPEVRLTPDKNREMKFSRRTFILWSPHPLPTGKTKGDKMSLRIIPSAAKTGLNNEGNNH